MKLVFQKGSTKMHWRNDIYFNKWFWEDGISTCTGEIQVTLRCHLTSVRIAILKKTRRAGTDVEKGKSMHTTGGNVNYHSQCEQQFEDSQKILN